ncbi:uncharacterized protein LOC112151376 isoform X2 [Oryzias melastigma]|uniref:uncharacterized protein LOC112151376 isoform X2 n=1 Tax=Oryzias melastigma TaxID=30732 RepID=UPI000CF82508|nr:uncharacterized protein LOC112151376 isoform X2 [Oryzias melastigma]
MVTGSTNSEVNSIMVTPANPKQRNGKAPHITTANPNPGPGKAPHITTVGLKWSSGKPPHITPTNLKRSPSKVTHITPTNPKWTLGRASGLPFHKESNTYLSPVSSGQSHTMANHPTSQN